MNKKNLIISLIGLMLANAVQAEGLRETVGKYFLIGTAMNTVQVRIDDPQLNSIVDKHFNAVVAENCMKAEELQPNEGLFDYRQADKLVEYAQKHNMTLTGHCLLWHSQAPRWFFKDELGNPCSREVLIGRIKDHIKAVMTYFKGKVLGWDVVNEAIMDDGSYRKSEFFKIIGPEFIEIAFRAAMEADPDAELYLNDFSMSNKGKREKYCEIIRDFKKKGIRIDAIGMQSHNGMDYPKLSEYEKSIDAFAAEGVKVMMTELDLNVLPNPKDFGGADIAQNFKYQEKYNPYKDGNIPADSLKKIDERWMDLWKIYYKHRDQISRVTLWGIEDGQSWLNNFPVRGRVNYPLLFDRKKEEKPVVKKIEKLFSK